MNNISNYKNTKNLSFGILYYILSFMFLAANLVSCAEQSLPLNSANPTKMECPPNTAQILVGDGFFRILCGCLGTNETNGSYFYAPQTLTCHLAPGSHSVIFNYSGTVLRHQIVPTGNSPFVPSMPSDPNQADSLRIYTAFFSQTAATYTFVDNFNNSMGGQIIIP